MKKAQMFVITMVFLVGLVFVIQQGFVQWFGYSMGFSSSTQRNDYYIFDNVKAMAGQTLEGSQSCVEARENLIELKDFLRDQFLSGYFLDFKYKLSCANWNNVPPNPAPLNMTIHVTGEDTDTYGSFLLYHIISPVDGTSPNIANAQVNPSSGPSGTIFTISAEITDPSGVDPATTIAHIQDPDETDIDTTLLHDDGINGDVIAGDNTYTAEWDSTGYCPSGSCSYFVDIRACDDLGNCGEAENV